jgi:hypothetical protein
VIGLETDQLFGVAQLIGLVSGRDRAFFGLLFGFQLGFASEPALVQEADRAIPAATGCTIRTIVRVHAQVGWQDQQLLSSSESEQLSEVNSWNSNSFW